MNKDTYKKIEKEEDNIIERFEEINNEIRELMYITGGLSKEFKESVISNVIEALSIINSSNTWERE